MQHADTQAKLVTTGQDDLNHSMEVAKDARQGQGFLCQLPSVSVITFTCRATTTRNPTYAKPCHLSSQAHDKAMTSATMHGHNQH